MSISWDRFKITMLAQRTSFRTSENKSKDNDEEMATEPQQNIFRKANLLHLGAAKIPGTL